MNYANVAHELLPYNMEVATLTIQSNSKWCHYYLIYWPNRFTSSV